MNIWLIDNPADYTNYARATQVNMWTDLKIDAEGNIDPLIMEWEPDSDIVADFTWPALASKIVVTEVVGVALLERFHGFKLGPVEMVQNTPLEKLQRQCQRGKKRVLLPYEGPKLVNLFVTKWVNVDLKRSSLQKEVLNTTGKIRYTAEGVEEYYSRWNPETKDLSHFHNPRVPGKGVFVDNSELNDADIFHIHEIPAFIFCTDPVKVFIEDKGYSNVRFLEYGDVMHTDA
jgi:hypothetical protein